MIRAILSRACLTAAALTRRGWSRRLRPLRPWTNGQLSHIAARGGMDKLKVDPDAEDDPHGRRPESATTSRSSSTRSGRACIAASRARRRPARRSIPRGINADDVWDMVQGKPVTRQPQPAAETRELDGDFDGLLVDWREKGHTVTLAGREKLPAARPQADGEVQERLVRTIYLDASTYLDRRQTGMLTLPNGRRSNHDRHSTTGATSKA